MRTECARNCPLLLFLNRTCVLITVKRWRIAIVPSTCQRDVWFRVAKTRLCTKTVTMCYATERNTATHWLSVTSSYLYYRSSSSITTQSSDSAIPFLSSDRIKKLNYCSDIAALSNNEGVVIENWFMDILYICK